MERKTWKEFQKDLHWSTRIFALATVSTVLLAALFRAWHTDFALTILGVLGLIFLVESLAISLQRHSRLWTVIGWLFLLVLLGLLLIG